MTYRADEVGLSLRIEHLEKEVAELEGTRAGLRAALAEASDRARVAQAKWKKAVRATRRLVIAVAGLAVGFLGGSTCSGSSVTVAALACAGSVEGTLDGTSLSGTSVEGSAPPARCAITVEGTIGDPAVDPDDEGCRAEVRCGDEVLYRGRGGCGEFFEAGQIEYWDHATSREDGTPAIVIAETEMLAVMRDDSGSVVTIQLAKSPDAD